MISNYFIIKYQFKTLLDQTQQSLREHISKTEKLVKNEKLKFVTD